MLKKSVDDRKNSSFKVVCMFKQLQGSLHVQTCGIQTVLTSETEKS